MNKENLTKSQLKARLTIRFSVLCPIAAKVTISNFTLQYSNKAIQKSYFTCINASVVTE